MAANESTKYQINYRLSDGTLINLYATDVKDLETGLADLGMVASLIKSTGADLGGSPLATATAVVAQAFPGATSVASPAPAGGNACRHGAMTFKEGVGSKGPWKAYMCPAPKGAADKCDPIWVK